MDSIEKTPDGEEEEKDVWDTALEKGGCVEEHLRLNDCYWDTHDWRKCTEQVIICL